MKSVEALTLYSYKPWFCVFVYGVKLYKSHFQHQLTTWNSPSSPSYDYDAPWKMAPWKTDVEH